ncbi:DUF3043 domain-containing protein [Amnibacterium flavum]|uniref:DUF3043 domain-containing protein n=1 Tax=Amnibacterium flavum TaxID=2173173 RepID=A0A2V1HPY9_9MICO|nr:DUF3043 domain-containing protein [Amnibacterium flavum]PVZ94666.1 DUF3043 domain-containing protein [Amnibacterium flavum]
MAKQPPSTTPSTTTAQPTTPVTDDEVSGAVGKGRPTPTRSEREAANRRPLVPTDRRLAAKEARAKSAALRERARLGMAAGEDRYLPTRDKGVQRKFVRDWVDARWGIGEFLIPIMGVVLVLSLIPDPYIQTYTIFALWGFFVLAVIDVVILGFILQRKLTAKFGEGRVERGFRWYAAMRALQLRALRLPKPQVKRRQYPS